MGVLRRLLVLLSPALILAMAPAVAAETASAKAPEAVVKDSSTELLQVIEEGKAFVEKDPDRFYRAVNATLEPVVDFPRFARGVMGAHWKRATPEQQSRFVDVFRWGLLKTYASALTEFGGGEIVVLEPQGEPKRPDRRGVIMEIRTSDGSVYPIDFSMALGKDGVWKIRNLKVAGVNIGLTYRSQFQSSAKDPKHRRDLDRVIDAWAEVVAEEAEKQQEDVQSAAASGR